MRPWKNIKELQHENEELKEGERSIKDLATQLALAFEENNPATRLKKANNACEQFL